MNKGTKGHGLINMKKRILSVFISFFLCMVALFGCSSDGNVGTTIGDNEISHSITSSEDLPAEGNPEDEPGQKSGRWLALYAIPNFAEEPCIYTYDSDYMLISEESTDEYTYYEYSGGDNPSQAVSYELDSLGNRESEPYVYTDYDEFGKELVSTELYTDCTIETRYQYKYAEKYPYVSSCDITTRTVYSDREETETTFYEAEYDENWNAVSITYYSADKEAVTAKQDFSYMACGGEYFVDAASVLTVDKQCDYLFTYTFKYDDNGNLLAKTIKYEILDKDGAVISTFGNFSFNYDELSLPDNPEAGQKYFRNVTVFDEDEDYSWSYEEEYIYVK